MVARFGWSQFRFMLRFGTLCCHQAPQSQPEDTTDGNAEDVSTWMHEGIHARVFP
eukprot:SAG25_NODE_14684_length_252_cov_0.666667_1_plen_54_part_10